MKKNQIEIVKGDEKYNNLGSGMNINDKIEFIKSHGFNCPKTNKFPVSFNIDLQNNNKLKNILSTRDIKLKIEDNEIVAELLTINI